MFKIPFPITDGTHRKSSKVIKHYGCMQVLIFPKNHGFMAWPQDSSIEGTVNLQKEEPYGTSLDPWGNNPEGDFGALAISFFSFASWCCDEQFVPANTPCRFYQHAYQDPRQQVHPNLE